MAVLPVEAPPDRQSEDVPPPPVPISPPPVALAPRKTPLGARRLSPTGKSRGRSQEQRTSVGFPGLTCRGKHVRRERDGSPPRLAAIGADPHDELPAHPQHHGRWTLPPPPLRGRFIHHAHADFEHHAAPPLYSPESLEGLRPITSSAVGFPQRDSLTERLIARRQALEVQQKLVAHAHADFNRKLRDAFGPSATPEMDGMRWLPPSASAPALRLLPKHQALGPPSRGSPTPGAAPPPAGPSVIMPLSPTPRKANPLFYLGQPGLSSAIERGKGSHQATPALRQFIS